MTPRRTADTPPTKPTARRAVTRKSAAGGARAVSADARRAMIAERAYLRAERRGFAPGHAAEDWLAAEGEIDLLLKAGPGGSSQ
ncbi:MAG TPA: DUF2934 domain-containing protein [Steroidobacteraceae bacterium]|jgi:hypothetical protein